MAKKHGGVGGRKPTTSLVLEAKYKCDSGEPKHGRKKATPPTWLYVYYIPRQDETGAFTGEITIIEASNRRQKR